MQDAGTNEGGQLRARWLCFFMRGNGKKIRFGVLSTARIGMKKVIPAMQKGEHTEVVAIASRSAEKAREAAHCLGIPRWHGSYEALLADPDVDAVYNPLPNDQHVLWSIRALEAGKHVLCEKPIALSAAEGRVLVEATRRHHDLKVMEALMYRHHPQWRKAKELVETGQIGELRAIQVFFSFYNDDPGNIRNRSSRGGGALMDIGCYASSLSRWLFDAEPQRVFGLVVNDSHLGVDRLVSAILDFGVGHATFTCSMAAYAEGIGILKAADAGKSQSEVDAETTPLRNPEHYQYELNLADISEVWRRGSVIASWLLDLTATALATDSQLAKFGGRVSDSGEGRWTIKAAIDEGVPVPVLTTALYERFSSRGDADYADRLLSAMRFGFGGHLEKSTK